MERLQTVSHYVKWISTAPAVFHAAGKAAGTVVDGARRPMFRSRNGSCDCRGKFTRPVGSLRRPAASDHAPHTWARGNATNCVLFATTRRRMGTKALSLISQGRNGDRATRRHAVFVKHSAWITAEALPGNDSRRHGMRPGMFRGDDRLGLLLPEGSLFFLSPHRDRVSQSAA